MTNFQFIATILFIFLFNLAQAQESTKKDSIDDPPLVTTQHSISISGQTINYTATTGYLVLREEDQTARAKIFFVAYTKDDEPDQATRPITFAFNGGPGSSSVWLHMGALGPKRIRMTERGEPLPPPYSLADNEYSWLDKTDLVFIDPVETGYSRPGGRGGQERVHGVRAGLGKCRRLYPPVHQPQRPLVVAQVFGGRKLRHHPGGGFVRLSPGPPRHVPERADADFGHSELSDGPLRQGQ